MVRGGVLGDEYDPKRKRGGRRGGSGVRKVAGLTLFGLLVVATLVGWSVKGKGKKKGVTLEDKIRMQTKQHQVVIYSKSYCPYSRRAKDVFDELDTEYFAYELDRMEDGSRVQETLSKITGIRTVPQVFVRGRLIGGGDDTVLAFETGRLEALLFPTKDEQ
ncbi:glutaredoxin [Chloropicon primus]|uniref:Glutaredoxin n=1 Tax=Chloropicon primus TaxID=1764295 RepID=A0A5B8MUL3_9CHLO|nr:glutaredoxin [Chloropicon primus]UPR03446.1 glutaredoxin [Chloropicon primus]|eukprot:QDZ24239.1 glutaredoxin [Chloropicon primus]